MEYLINHIFSIFKKLTHLTFSESSYQKVVQLSFDYPQINFISSTLLVLDVKVYYFNICLRLLDGRFNQLHTFIVQSSDLTSFEEMENKVSFY
jgi:hypothetical protein